MHLLSLARWLARKAVTAEWRAEGRKVQYIGASEITEASNIYLTLHRNELLKEAWEHPAFIQYRERERMSLARKAVIAEIRDNGRKVSSIAPSELQRLIEAYLQDHPEDTPIREFGCH